MAADQRRRRLNSRTFVGCSFRGQREQYRAKKKKVGLPQDGTNMRSNISLEWDDKSKSVVAKREQIGLLQRDLVTFIDVVPHCYGSLVDILSIPREIFGLENLVNVLSYEVWQTYISETERNILTQFLPKGPEPEKVVQELLSGDNFHFGNPFLKWGAALCSGKFHPDDVLQREQRIKANKKTHFSELQKYHYDMIEDLQIWKDTWDRCKDAEEEILEKIWRSRRKAGKSLQLSESRFNDPEENNIATPESCSWDTSEKACSNDNNHNLAWDSQERKGFSDSNLNNSSGGLKGVANPKKGEKLQRRNIQLGDGAKYMSYIKVSKEQHQRVKRTMKHTSNSIQPRSLNNVLGNLDTLHVQPFEVFEEEERQKLHDYWLQLVKKDITVGYANWIKKKLKAQQMAKALGQELEGRLKFQEEEDEKGNSHNLSMDLIDDVEAMVSPNASAQELYCQDEKREVSLSFLEDQMANQATKDESSMELEDEEEKETHNLPQQTPNGTENMEEDDGPVSISAEEDREEKIASISDRHQVNNMTVESRDNDMIAKVDDLPPVVSEFLGNMNRTDIPITQRDPPDCACDVWSAVSEPGSLYHSASLGHQYASSSELSLSHPQVMEEQPAQIIISEADAQEKDSGRELLHRESDGLSLYGSFPNQEQILLQEKNDGKQMLHREHDDVSFFGGYPTQNRNEQFESFFKGHGGSLPYHQEQKRLALDFHQPDNLTMENGQFSTHFMDQVNLSPPMEMRQKRMNDLYMDHNIQDSMYSDEGRYSISKHLPVNVQDWGVSTVRMLAPSQCHISGGILVSQNWFPGENRARGAWSGLEGAVASSRSLGSQSNLDQSLFSVLSECNELHSGAPAPYDSVCSPDRFMQPGTYNALGGGIPSTSSILQQTGDPLNYFSGHEAGAGGKINNLGWMSVSHQNPGLQDSMGKAFVRSWNQ